MTDANALRLRIAVDLREIIALYADLRAEAVSHAADPDLPGGDAMVMLGPSADPEAWSYRQLSAALGRTEPHGLYENDSDPQPPLLVLATWEDCIRQELQTPTDKRATIEGAAKFLASSIDWCLDTDEAGDVNFIAIDDMAADISKVRRRLEAVLHDGEQRDVSRVTCIHCDAAPRLVKKWGSLARWDEYRCPSCRKPYDWGQFLQAKATNLRAEGTERFVLATQASDAVPDVPTQTMRSWMRRAVVRTACDIKTKRLIVWWPDVRDAAETRRVDAIAKSVKRPA